MYPRLGSRAATPFTPSGSNRSRSEAFREDGSSCSSPPETTFFFRARLTDFGSPRRSAASRTSPAGPGRMRSKRTSSRGLFSAMRSRMRDLERQRPGESFSGSFPAGISSLSGFRNRFFPKCCRLTSCTDSKRSNQSFPRKPGIGSGAMPSGARSLLPESSRAGSRFLRRRSHRARRPGPASWSLNPLRKTSTDSPRCRLNAGGSSSLPNKRLFSARSAWAPSW